MIKHDIFAPVATGKLINSDPPNLSKMLQGKRAFSAKMMSALRSVIEKIRSDQ
jgi:hypothetical protein